MAQAIRLARRGLGTTWPNPSVGAVLVRPDLGGTIVGRGVTSAGGTPHAETAALAEAGAFARGATLYVNLEPCSHHGRTPPCADAILAAGVQRIVVGIEDPNPLVAGAGLARLRDAGIDVVIGVLESEARRVTRGHIMRMTQGRPAITLKLAVGSDGRVPAGNGAPNFVTGAIARAHAHLLRARHDAILIGRGTAETDDPLLTCRLPGMGHRSPVRILLDSRLRMNPSARMLTDKNGPPVWIVCAHDAPPLNEDRLAEAGAQVLRVNATPEGRTDLRAAMAALASRGMTRVLIEGGPHIAAATMDAGIADEIALYRGALPAGPQGLQPFVTRGLDRLEEDAHLMEAGTRSLGDDLLDWRVKV